MARPDPVIVIGSGLTGAAATWALTRRDVPVIMIEQYGPGHHHGSSYGSARIVRRAYDDPMYVDLTGRAFDLWDELATSSQTALIRFLGSLDMGPHVPAVAQSLSGAGVPHAVLSAREAAELWVGIRFTGPVLFHEQAGTLDADAAVAAFRSVAATAGAQLCDGVTVRAIHRTGGTAVELDDGTVLPARCVVVAAGGWTASLLGDTTSLPPLLVTEQSVLHFPRMDPNLTPWPSMIHVVDAQHAVYHLAGGHDGGVDDDRKIARHEAGPVVSAADRARSGRARVEAGARRELTDYVRQWLPGLQSTPSSETTCLYTTTPSTDFVLDRIGDVVICSPCSGHGAKFSSLVGELAADLVMGADADSVPDRFRLFAHLGSTAPAG